MDAAGMALAQLMRQRMSPVVMVMATPLAEATSRKNELGIVDLLRPFCVLDQVDVPVRTASELPYRLQDFELRIYYASDVAQPSAEVAEEYLVECVGNASDEAAAALLGDPKDIDVVKKMVESETQASWFPRYCRDYMRTLAFSEHEAIDHPIACLLVVSSRDENPLTQFVDLYNPDCLPALVKDGAMDPKVLKHYVLLHDIQDGPLDEPNKILLEMRGTFQVNNCGILSINSRSVDSDSPPDDIWSGRLLQPIVASSAESKQASAAEVSNKRPGLCLDKGDVAELSDFVLDLTLKQIIPHMEQKIRMLNQQVSATRRGLKNQLKNLWWRKGKEETSDVLAGGQYTFSSMESQIRVLADYAFMLRDYDLALQNYRLLSSDYKTDKAWKRYAGVQEMIGLCLFMMDQSRREAAESLESALSVYQKCGGLTTKYATRTSIWLAELHKARGQFREGANVLFRAAMMKVEGGQGVSLRAGLLLEQAAYCYLRVSTPMLRKYGFHMVLAGNRYTVCSQRKHAMRVYRSVLSIFEGQGWKYISDHVHFHLGRLSHFLGNHDLAILHFMKLVTCSHQSPANQSNFLREFLYIVENTVGKDQVLDLELPTIDAEHVHVHFEDHRTYSSSSAAAKAENVWSPVEEGLTPSVAVPLHTWLDAPKSLTQAIDFNVCIAGEEIGVDVEFSNPLQVPIDISSVCLTCDFDDIFASKPEFARKPVLPDTNESTAESSDDQSSNHSGDNSLESTVGSLAVNTTPAVLLPEELFQLQAGEIKVVRLKAKPVREGVLKVTGVRWLLAGVATGHRDFSITGPQISKSKNRARSNPPPDQRLKFHILPHMPRLEVSMHELPTKVNTGELHRVVLELYNPSKISVKRLKFKTSHPNVLLVGKAGDLDMEFPSCLEVQAVKEGEPEVKPVDFAELKNGPSVFSFPEDTLLDGGSTVLWPLWLHARQPGPLSLNSIIYYESESTSVGLKYRTVRMTESIQVVPSLKVSVQISPSPLHLQQFLLRLDVKNQNASESFWLRQVSCTGDRWRLSPLLPPVLETEAISGRDSDDNAAFLSSSVTASQLLPASQTLSLFFKLNVAERVCKSNTDEVSNIILGPPSSSEPLIDIAAGPLSEFHALEKLDQPRATLPYFLQKNNAVKGLSVSLNDLPDGREVDVVLISEQQEGGGGPTEQNSGLRVGAHHICHCSVQGAQPFVWVMEGPRSVSHNFLSQPFCEVPVVLTIRNCSIYTAFIKIETQDLVNPQSTAASSQETQYGWTTLNTSTSPVVDSAEANVVADPVAPRNHVVHRTPTPPFLWCHRRSTSINSLAPGASAKVSLCVAFLAPGIYDLSGYRISWTLLELVQSTEVVEVSEMSELNLKTTSATYSAGYVPPVVSSSQSDSHGSSDAANISASGVGFGHPLLLSVVQSNT